MAKYRIKQKGSNVWIEKWVWPCFWEVVPVVLKSSKVEVQLEAAKLWIDQQLAPETVVAVYEKEPTK